MFDLGRAGFSSKSTMRPAWSSRTQPCRPAKLRRSGMRTHRVTGAARSRAKRSGAANSKVSSLSVAATSTSPPGSSRLRASCRSPRAPSRSSSLLVPSPITRVGSGRADGQMAAQGVVVEIVGHDQGRVDQARAGQVGQQVVDERSAADLDQGLGPVREQRADARPVAGGQQHGVHACVPPGRGWRATRTGTTEIPASA